MPLHPGPDARIFRISRLRVTYEVRKFFHHFHCCCFEDTNGLWFVYKTKFTLEMKRKHLKDILREVKFILVLCLHYNLKNIDFILVFLSLFTCMSSLRVFLSL